MNRAESALQVLARPAANATPAVGEELPGSLSAKVKPGHLCRKAIVYVRQSTAQQVMNHQESTARQYALDGRAVQLGWAAESVVIVDEDQGRSGQSAAGRSGFAYLLSEVALNHVGIILGLETSRLARPTRTGINCWTSARSFRPCWPIKTASMIRPSTTTACCWA